MLASRSAVGFSIGSTAMDALHLQRLQAKAHLYSAIPNHSTASNAADNLGRWLLADGGCFLASTPCLGGHTSPVIRNESNEIPSVRKKNAANSCFNHPCSSYVRMRPYAPNRHTFRGADDC